MADAWEFIKYIVAWVGTQLGTHGLKFIPMGIETIIQFIALNMAAIFGNPRYYDPAWGFEANGMLYGCLFFSGYVLLAFILRLFRLRNTPNKVGFLDSIWWVTTAITIYVIAWNYLEAMVVFVAGWLLVKLFSLGAGMTRGNKGQIISAVKGLVFAGFVMYVLIRAMYAASLIY